jgi:hypothetical protein
MKTPETDRPQPQDVDNTPESPTPKQQPCTSEKEIGGRGGLDPTRYGDWEKGGKCVDF